MARPDRINAKNRGVTVLRQSSLEALFPTSRPGQHAAVTCGTARDRSVVFYHILHRAITAGMPVIVLYSTDYTRCQLERCGRATLIGPDRPHYMPLLGMDEDQALSAISSCSADRSWSPGEWDALQDYLHLLVLLQQPISLRHLLWLVQLNRGDFEALLSSRYASSLSDRDRRYYLDATRTYFGGAQSVNHLVCSRIQQLEISATAERIFDRRNDSPDCSSIFRAIRDHSVLGISLDAFAASRFGMTALCDELRIARTGRIPFLLCCCDLTIPENSPLAGQLLQNDSVMTTVLSVDHMPAAFPSQRGSDYWAGMLRGSLLVLNCNSAGTAASYEELFGSYRRLKTTVTQNRTRQPLHILSSVGRAMTVSEEDAPRIRQETLCSNPQGGVFFAGGSGHITVIGDLGL